MTYIIRATDALLIFELEPWLQKLLSMQRPPIEDSVCIVLQKKQASPFYIKFDETTSMEAKFASLFTTHIAKDYINCREIVQIHIDGFFIT